MVKLSIQDEFDGSSRVSELRSAIGNTFNDNQSRTGNSKLLEVSDSGNTAYTVEVIGTYSKVEPNQVIKKQPSWLVYNGIFH